MVHVARGVVDAYIEDGFGGPWDVCAGIVIVKEAGGFVGNVQGENMDKWDPQSTNILACSSGELGEEIGEVVRQVDQSRNENKNSTSSSSNKNNTKKSRNKMSSLPGFFSSSFINFLKMLFQPTSSHFQIDIQSWKTKRGSDEIVQKKSSSYYFSMEHFLKRCFQAGIGASLVFLYALLNPLVPSPIQAARFILPRWSK